jgi:hypothetical protein
LNDRGRVEEGEKMTALRIARSVRASIAVFCRDVGHGMLEVSHNTLALVGFFAVAVLAFAGGHADLRRTAETQALAWLQARHEARAERDGNLLVVMKESGAVSRATATDPRGLTEQQAAVAQWISRRYRVAPEPISRLVQEAWAMGPRAGVEPTLILAVMAVESSFNPFAQSSVGAQGLMQVLTRVHDDKYQGFGGVHAAFDPVTNLKVGVQILRDYIARTGSVEGGLRYYVGAANLPDDGGYAARVLAEQSLLKRVAAGKAVPPATPAPVLKAAPRDAEVAPTAKPAEPAPVQQVVFAG